MSSGDLLRKAEELFGCGRYQECEELLQLATSQLVGFTRQQWSVRCNTLACQMKVALMGGDVCALRSLYGRYCSLWDQMRGLPPILSSIPTELGVVCALYQLKLAIVGHSLVEVGERERNMYTELLARMQTVECEEEGHGLPTVAGLSLSARYGSATHKSMVKLSCIRALLMLISGLQDKATEILKAIASALHTPVKDGSDAFDAVLSVGNLVHGSSSEMTYAQAWSQYKESQYSEAVQTLQPLLHSSTAPPQTHPLTHPHITSASRLMAGACYLHMNKPNLALCSYQQCVASHTPATLPALLSCAAVFKRVKNSEAECQIRDLLVKALRLREEEGDTKRDGVLWKSEDDGVSLLPPSLPGLELAESVHCSAVRSLQLQKYSRAASCFREVTETLSLSPSLHPPSVLHLLRAQALVCGGEWEEGERVCAQLAATLDPTVSSYLRGNDARGGTQFTLSLSQALWLRGVAALQLKRLAEAKQHWERGLSLVLSLLANLHEDQHTEVFNSARQLQVFILNDLAVLSVGLGHPTTAMQHVAEVIVASHPHPSPLTSHYNHCLLLGKQGRMAGVAKSWLRCRGGEGLTVDEGKEKLCEARRKLASLSPESREHQLSAMDVAMWGLWMRHKH